MPDFVRSGGVTMGNAVIEVKADSDGNPTECCNPVTGVCLSGGGDLDIVEVTISCDFAPDENDYIAMYGVEVATDSEPPSFSTDQIVTDTPESYNYITYKGKAYLGFEAIGSVTISDIETTGDIVVDIDNSAIVVNGAGTILFKTVS